MSQMSFFSIIIILSIFELVIAFLLMDVLFISTQNIVLKLRKRLIPYRARPFSRSKGTNNILKKRYYN